MKNDTNKEVKRVETMLLPHWYQQLSKSKEFNSRMPAMYTVKWPDSGCKAESSQQLRLNVDLGQEVFPTMETASIFRYHHVIMLRVYVSSLCFLYKYNNLQLSLTPYLFIRSKGNLL